MNKRLPFRKKRESLFCNGREILYIYPAFAINPKIFVMNNKPGRVLSLDIFRGLTVAFMIMVNNQRFPAFPALKHMPWDGCTPTDLVFPFFLFIVGVSMWFSYRKQNHELNKGTVWRLFKRGSLIFLVGLALHWFPFYDFSAGQWISPANIRIMGVLQRIGIAFFVGGVFALWLKTYKRIGIASAVILVGYWLLVNIFGDATQEGFIGNRIDAFLLGANHLYRPEIPFDPEGLFSTIPVIATILLGYATGKFVGENREDKWKTLGGLGVAGGLFITVALLFNSVCPINKPIWSSTYVLYTAGLAMQVWMVLLWFYDYKGKRFGATFGATFGTNALFAYLLAGVLMKVQNWPFLRITEAKVSVYNWWVGVLRGVMTPELGSLVASMTLIALIWAIVYPLYRKKIFIKL